MARLLPPGAYQLRKNDGGRVVGTLHVDTDGVQAWALQSSFEWGPRGAKYTLSFQGSAQQPSAFDDLQARTRGWVRPRYFKASGKVLDGAFARDSLFADLDLALPRRAELDPGVMSLHQGGGTVGVVRTAYETNRRSREEWWWSSEAQSIQHHPLTMRVEHLGRGPQMLAVWRETLERIEAPITKTWDLLSLRGSLDQLFS